VSGVKTTIPFCRCVLQHPAFRSGHFSTHFVSDHFDPEALSNAGENEAALALAAVLHTHRQAGNGVESSVHPAAAPAFSPWERRKRL
jgi:propionyl-CoA carboxylase alpha chain